MITANISIPGLEETITRPAILTVIPDLKRLMGVSEDVPTLVGDTHTNLLEEGFMGKINSVTGKVDEQLTVNYTETTVNNDFGSLMRAVNPNSFVLYHDTEIHSRAIPLPQDRKVTLNLRYVNRSKAKVHTVLNKLRMLNYQNINYGIHDIEYHYIIPTELLYLMYNIVELKNNKLATPTNLDEYMGTYCDSRVEGKNSIDGVYEKVSVVSREKQTGVTGKFLTQLDGLEKEHEEDTNLWALELEYEFRYSKPIEIQVTYPLTVYNQPMPSDYLTINRKSIPVNGVRTPDDEAVDTITLKKYPYPEIDKQYGYIKIPDLDNLMLPKPSLYHVRLFSVYSIIEETDPTHLLYLDEISYIEFKQPILDLIKEEISYCGIENKTIFNFALYDHKKRIYGNKLILSVVTAYDNNGDPFERIKISSTEPLDIKGQYRVTFNILTNLDLIPRERLKELKTSIEATDMVNEYGVDNMSVLDMVLLVLNVDNRVISDTYRVTPNTTSFDIATHLSERVWLNMYTKQSYLTLTQMFNPKD